VYDLSDLDAARSAVDGDWDAVRGLLGGKGANLADMASMGIPVPPGFTITTRACNAFVDRGGRPPDGMWDEVDAAMAGLEAATGKTYGSTASPLLVAARWTPISHWPRRNSHQSRDTRDIPRQMASRRRLLV
jgi:pyruvate,orthophosphate dikinase